MSEAEVYYFSGTGNSLAVARDISLRLNASPIPVTRLMNENTIDSGAGVIGLVFPIYDFKAPQIIRDVIPRLRNIDSKYLFAVCTYGIAPSGSLKHLAQVARSCGGHLSGGFAVAMPHNGIGSGAVAEGQDERMFADWETKLEEICEYVDSRRKGRIESGLLPCLSQFRFITMAPSLLKFLMHVAFKGIDSLALASSSDCNGCGTCSRVCPMKNIEIVENRPKWLNRCTGCFACLHWCPREAISMGGVNMGMRRYHHPDVSISDMVLGITCGPTLRV